MSSPKIYQWDIPSSLFPLPSSFVKNLEQMVARYSEAEFVLLLPKAKPPEAIKMIETLQAEIEQLKINSSGVAGLSANVSFGIASLVPQFGLSPQQLLTHAEQAFLSGCISSI